MSPKTTAVVITSIAAPNDVMKSIAAGCGERAYHFFVIGDVPSPPDFQLDNCQFYGFRKQLELDLRTAKRSPKRHYARKNIGYLLAISSGSDTIIETDDDNFPLPNFWECRNRIQYLPVVTTAGWLNAYRYFSEANIWPRGLPLDEVTRTVPDFAALGHKEVDCPIQQGLANENPDVDAVYRLLLPLPLNFRSDRRLALGSGVWCPFNSQNTTWFRDAFPLLYLPAFCSFRMTDIWRSFVVQRISWECGWNLLFHEPTVYQKRNDHNLMRDFEEEVPGYLQNRNIAEILDRTKLSSGIEHLEANLYQCYEELVRNNIFEPKELALVEAWIEDLRSLSTRPIPVIGAGASPA
jgi:hypothetical protein